MFFFLSCLAAVSDVHSLFLRYECCSAGICMQTAGEIGDCSGANILPFLLSTQVLQPLSAFIFQLNTGFSSYILTSAFSHMLISLITVRTLQLCRTGGLDRPLEVLT